MNKIERRISHFAMRYERLLIAKNETEVQIALRGVLCDECQERLDAREDADW